MNGRFSSFGAVLKRPVRDSRGVVLITVLWICALITWFALQISAETRLQGDDRIQAIRKSQALYLAVGGCYEAIARMGQPPPLNIDSPPEQNWQPDGKPRLVSYDTGRAVVIIEAEDSKVNVNRVAQPQLRQIIERAGADEDLAEQLADHIMDFVDQDDSPRLKGGEEAVYKKSGLNYGPFNGPLTSLDQLLLIPGITERSFYGYGGTEDEQSIELAEIYRDFLIPGKRSLFSMLTVYGNTRTLPSNLEIEESEVRPITWKPGGIYRILSFGMSGKGPPAVGIWLTVRYSPQEQSPFRIVSRKVL